MDTATTEVSAEPAVPGRLFVPMIPPPREVASDRAKEEWRKWLWRVATFRDFRMFRPIDRPCRLVAVVRTVADRGQPPLATGRLEVWADSVRAVAVRVGLVPADLLLDVEAVHEPLYDVPLLEQPIVTGTEFVFYEEVR